MLKPLLIWIAMLAVCCGFGANLCENAALWTLEGKSRDYSRLDNSAEHGRNALRLRYDFKIMEPRDNALIVRLKKPVSLPEGTGKVTISIHDSASNHRFYFFCRDAKGKSVLFSRTEGNFRTLRRSGWQECGFSPLTDPRDVWGGNSGESKELAYPLQLISFWLDPMNRNQLQGELHFAGLAVDRKEAETAEAPAPVAAKTSKAPELKVDGRFYGTVSWTGDEQALTFRFSPGDRSFGACDETVDFLDRDGNRLAQRRRPFETSPYTVTLPEEVRGFYLYRYRLIKGGEVLFESQGTGSHFDPVAQPAPEAARLGMGFWNSDYERAYATLRKMGIRWIRFDAGWSWIEPRKGEFHWDSTERLLRAARENGMSTLVTTQYVPRWAAMQPYHQYGGNPDPVEWERFYRQLIERCGKKISVYEVWNEPDTPYHWSGGAKEYAKHLKETAKIIRRYAPDALIAHAGLTGEEKLWRPFSEELAKQDIGGSFDLYTFHYGKGQSAPLHRKILRQAGLGGKRLWNTESGWGSLDERILQILGDFAAGVEKSFYFEFQPKVSQFAATGMMTPEFRPERIMPQFLTLSRRLDGSRPVTALPFPGGVMYRVAPDTVAFRSGKSGVAFRTDKKELTFTDGYGQETRLHPAEGFISVPAANVGYLTLPETFETLPAMIEFTGSSMPVAGVPNKIALFLYHPGEKELKATLKLTGSRQWKRAEATRRVVLRPKERLRVELELHPDLLSSETPFRYDAVLEVDGRTAALQSFTGVVQAPVRSEVRAVFQDNRPGVRVTLRNLLPTPLKVETALHFPAGWNCDDRRSIELAPQGESEYTLLFDGKPEIRKDQFYFVTAVTVALGTPARAEHRLNWIGVPAASPGRELPLEAELRERKQYIPNNPILETWLGPEDLSCRFFWGWSPEKIRMRWDVTDDQHVNDNEPAFAWDRDSIQIWYDGALYDLALIGGKSVIYAHEGAAAAGRMTLEVVRHGTHTLYQLEIRPEPGRAFEAGMNFPFSFCVNDNDGEPIRKGWMYHFARTGEGGERKKSPPVTLMAK